MQKIIIVALSIILLLSLCISVTAHAEDPIKDSFYFNEDERIILDWFISNEIYEKTEEGKGYTWQGKYVEVVLSFRCFTSHEADFMGKFSRGMSVQEVLASLPIYDCSMTPAMFPGVTVIFQGDDKALWAAGEYDVQFGGDEVVITMGEFFMNSAEESIAQKNPEVNLETLEIQEVYFLDETRYRGGCYVFLFTNQGNYVFYQDHFYPTATSYFLTETEFYELMPKENAKPKYGLVEKDDNSKSDSNNPPPDPSPLGENPKAFTPQHLYWIIPTAVVLVAGGIGWIVWQGKRRKHQPEK